MGDNKLDQRFYPEVYQAVAGENYTVYAYMNDGSVREFDVKPLIKQGVPESVCGAAALWNCQGGSGVSGGQQASEILRLLCSGAKRGSAE